MTTYQNAQELATACVAVLQIFGTFNLVCLFFVPVITLYLNIWFNKMVAKDIDNVYHLIAIKMINDYFTFFLQSKVVHKLAFCEAEKLIVRLNMAKLKCGVPIPGVTQKKHEELNDDKSKLRDFLHVIPITWASIISFIIMIYNLESNSDLPVRSSLTLVSFLLFLLMTYFTDPTLYERTKPSNETVTSINDTNMVKMKLSMGCALDENYHIRKRMKQDSQADMQKCAICFFNILITYFSIVVGDKSHINSFGGISWMIAMLSDNVKSFGYHSFVKEFLSLCECFESHEYAFQEPRMALGKIHSVEFKKATFGYFDDDMASAIHDDLVMKPVCTPRITKLSFTFHIGKFYYLEAPNGVGKSTLLRMFQSNLLDGDVFFGNINRKNLSFEDVSKSVFHITQASEYTPKFSQEEIIDFKGKDKWLEKQLGLTSLFEKATVEMSGGQKKRMFIYMVLTSNAPIILLDEVLSELSTEETPEVPEGGGWLRRVIFVLTTWKGLKNKITILVGHGLVDLIPNNENIIKLQIQNENKKTILSLRNKFTYL